MPSATQRLGATVSVRAASRDSRTIEIVASDFSKDSYNTRVDPSGWDLTQFIRNPVILAFHNDYKFPVARGVPESIRVDRGELRMTIQFPEAGKHPDADVAFELYHDGFMRGVSVGFLPTEWEDQDEGEGEDRQSVRVYKKVKLLEVSLVPIPSNDNALAQRSLELNRDPEEAKQRMAELERLMEERSRQQDPEEVEKWKTYFDRKQPVNKAASRAMARFFKARGLEQPSDELEAFTRMSEIIEEEANAEAAPAGEPEEKVTETETTTVEEEVKEAEVTQTAETTVENPEEPTPPVQPAAEAPQPAPEAPVQLSLDQLSRLPRAIKEACDEAVVEASRRGVPPSDWDSVIEATAKQFLKALPR